MANPSTILLAFTVTASLLVGGCVDGSGPGVADDLGDALPQLPLDLGICLEGTGGPAPPPGEEAIGLKPIDLIFGGSLRHPLTRVAMVIPTHGDLGSPTNQSRSQLAYLQATLEGMLGWEPAIDRFIETYPQYSYLDNVSVQIEIFEEEVPDTLGYDIVIGYVASGPAFRGAATQVPPDTQAILDEAGLGEAVHHANRYIVLSLFAYSERAGQTQPDFPETPELRGVTMHEFAHTWGLGHSTTFTPGCGADLMNSPYPYVYGDGTPLGDGGERTIPLCITSLDLYGLAHLYRWMPNGTWEGSQGNVSLPTDMVYEWYCDEGEAATRAQALIAEQLDPTARARLGA